MIATVANTEYLFEIYKCSNFRGGTFVVLKRGEMKLLAFMLSMIIMVS